jgi:Concanavalin A-like lectin/glucanases superfamily
VARLATTGAEIQRLSTTLALSGETPFVPAGTVGIDAVNQRTGVACYSFATGGANYLTTAVAPAATARNYYGRAYIRITANPAVAIRLMAYYTSTTVIGYVQLETNGTLTLRNAAGTQVGSATGALTAGIYYRVELRCNVPASGGVNNGTLELALDGVIGDRTSTTTQTGTAVATPSFRVGQIISVASTVTVYADDIAVNDDQGAGETGYPGGGRVVILKPTGDAAVGTGWLNAAGTGTALYDCVDNVPPTGVATPSGTSQIQNATSTAGSSYDATLQTYTAGGVKATQPVKLTRGVARLSGSSTTGTNDASGRVVSNPADSGDTTWTAAFDIVAGTDPTAGWQTWYTAVVYLPSVTLGTGPVMRVNKITAATRIHQADFMGLIVEYGPHTLTLAPATETDAAQALTFSKPIHVTLTPAAETDAGQAATATHPRTVTPAAEVDAGVTLSITHDSGTHRTLTPAVETDVAAGGVGGYDPAILADAPVAFWPLNELAGPDAVDATGHGNACTYSAGITYGQTGIGDGETAVSIAGAGSAAGGTGLILGDGPLTLEAWVKQSGGGGNYGIISKSTGAYYLRISGNKLDFLASQTADIVQSTITLDTGWHHVAATKTGATVKLYIDGNDVTGTVVNHALGNGGALSLASDLGGGSEKFSGSIAKIAAYNVVLTPTQIAAHYAAKSSPGLSHSKQVVFTPAPESDAAQSAAATHPRTVTPAAETDAGQAARAAHPRTVTPAAETDAALATSFTKPIRKTAAAALETDAGQAARAAHPRTVTPAAETDAALATSFTKPIRKTAAAALETDTALAAHPVKPRTLAAAVEQDAAQASVPSKRAALIAAAETDAALAASAGGAKTLTPAEENDAVQATSSTKPIHKMLAPALEAAAAIAGVPAKRCATIAALETDQARATNFVKPIHASLALAAELDVAATPTIRKRAQLLAAAEADQARPAGGAHARRLAAADELDVALALFRFGLAPAIDLPATLEVSPAAVALATRDVPTLLAVGAPTTTLQVKPYDTELATDGDQ